MSTAPRIAAAKRDWGHDEARMHGAAYRHGRFLSHPSKWRGTRNTRGKPVIIGIGNRSVVSAASYEARQIRHQFGDGKLPGTESYARTASFCRWTSSYYREMSRSYLHRRCSRRVTDRIEQVSVDECYMDVSGALLRWEQSQRHRSVDTRSGGLALPHHLFRRHRGEQAGRQNGFDQCQAGRHAA